MASLLIQSVDEQLAARLKQRAGAARKSISQFVLDTLRQHLGLEKEQRFTAEHDDLDSFFGAWMEEEFSSIQGSISAERRIDPEPWLSDFRAGSREHKNRQELGIFLDSPRVALLFGG